MIRIGIAALMQESNSFAPSLATREEFDVYLREDILRQYEGTNSEVGGFLEGCAERDWEAVPLFTARATSGGALSRECFEGLLSDLLEAVRTAELDALLLALHGAMSAEHLASGDAEIVSRLRAEAGWTIPIVVTHDLHANVLPELLEAVDGLAGYRTYPHVDQRETALRAVALLDQRLRGGSARRWQLRIPMLLVPQAGSTFEPPLEHVMQQMSAAFPDDEQCCATLFTVQPWLDFSPVASCLTVTDFTGNPNVPQKMLEIGRQLWACRNDFETPWASPDQLIEEIHREGVRPLLVSEAYDSPSGGATGDHAGLLRTVLPYADEVCGCLFLIDPKAASHAAAAGVGAQIEVELGGKLDRRFSLPVSATVKVLGVSNGEFHFKGPAFHGLLASMGPSATLGVGKLSIVVGSRPVFMIDPELYRSQGVEPAEQEFVGVKSPTLFRPAYKSLSENIVHFDMPGPCRGKLTLMPYQNISRPMFPLDEFEWSPTLKDVSICGGNKTLATEASK
ncbi:MAG TPA: M81 family metallopeptidase [Bryobacteraceae bacterium]|nr:M81 family metallopeptidase [Bryobacteraceae bacterium]